MSATASATAPVPATIAAFRAAADRGDADAVAPLLAPDVALHSPLTDRVRFDGRDEVAALHHDIFAVLHDLRTSDPLRLGDRCAAPFSARVRGVELRAVILVQLDAQGLIADLEIYGRPLPALAALFSALPPRVSARRRGRLTGALVAVLARPLAFALHIADRLAPRFL
ncbi:nuclear transport factor 2 family protein [Conexibacter sp. JD483]|uniref:nuclear transport factor 2 family protein n=1 Tax=unclassified Conexibacter TaxID=2627773 RepID=UPI0027212CF7|nr:MULTISPECIES: nuclear transport factor 2 family protein [unclassified Conexibacter]MDO8189248.1 nuclear transport factor 2 family protein [Conexibacter sp. CPCC 205706]MDO8198734.1 nuclear transport factor 2 family protein [Conexibacter sp. CPCC 205762]MDR9372121.1 nuclear transport factor 2 family protein [Conexibacter sp. JD483]